MQYVSVDPDLYQMLINFVEENFESFKQRCIEGGIVNEDSFDEWFDEQK